jgi:hypothetical protein
MPAAIAARDGRTAPAPVVGLYNLGGVAGACTAEAARARDNPPLPTGDLPWWGAWVLCPWPWVPPAFAWGLPSTSYPVPSPPPPLTSARRRSSDDDPRLARSSLEFIV